MDKLHENKDWMTNAYVVQGKSVREISDELHISHKLVSIWLKQHGLA